MTTRIRTRLLPMLLLLMLALSLPGIGLAAAQEATESQKQLPIEIRVLPPKADPMPLQSTPSDEKPPSPVPPMSLPGTVSAVLVNAATQPGGDRWESMLTLVVTDDRGYAAGWHVLLAAETTSPNAETMALGRYRYRTEVLAGQMTAGIAGPHGNRLAVGQPLSASPMVMVAAPGAGHGTYALRMGLTASREYVPGPTTFVLTLPSAP